MPDRSERRGLLHRLKPSIWLDEGAGGEKGLIEDLSRTLVLGEFSHRIQVGYFAFCGTAPLPLWRSFHSNVKFPGSTVYATGRINYSQCRPRAYGYHDH
jgi:hypothetical protein